MDQEPWAELGETISAIRHELTWAMDDGEGETLKFQPGPVELEFTVAVKKEGKARAKVLVVPWTFEGGGSLGTERTHRIKLTLQPADAAGEGVLISGSLSEQPE